MGLKFLHKVVCLVGRVVVLGIEIGRTSCFETYSLCILLDLPFLLAMCGLIDHTNVALTWMRTGSIGSTRTWSRVLGMGNGTAYCGLCLSFCIKFFS